MLKNSSSQAPGPQNNTACLPSHPKIKPLIHRYSPKNPLDDRSLKKYLIFHPKTPSSNAIISHVSKPKSPSLHYTKRYIKLIKVQGPLSRLSYSFPENITFQSEFLCAKLRNLSSLSSLHLKFSSNSSLEKPLKALTKSLECLKNLSDVKIQFHAFHFNGQGILHKLFNSLGNLRKLTSLSVSFLMCSNFKGSHLDVLSAYLKKFPQLKSLQLGFDRYLWLYDHDLEDLADSLVKLKNLIKIDINFGGERCIDGTTLIRFFKSFQAMKNLSDITMNLRSCEIDNRYGFDCLAEGLSQLNGPSIKKLQLHLYRNLDEKSLVKISQALQRFNGLNTLCLNFFGSGSINNEGITELASTLKGLPSLSSLNITFPSFVEADFHVIEITHALRSMQKLTHLQLDFARNDRMTVEHVQELFISLKFLSSLQFLDISLSHQKSLSDNALGGLAQSLKSLSQLKHLLLNFNRTSEITNKGVQAISGAVKEMKGLSSLVLNLGYNENIDEKAINKIVKAIRSVKSLHMVNFSFMKCAKIMRKEDSLVRLFDALRDIKNICEVYLCLSYSELNEQETNELKQRKSVQTFWI